ncbi:SDR family NAD(P)-dependent oxidoreductase [Pleomorphomonas oryzae]|uniref:SDR family NAD(P)-dependent oxidoreductase n=1 Tax=Pleomorphomonas oryzae TaxID=261934 RepID=UPI0004034272|nr:SDR family NAD(P)-dependent oxidoreductase [Pleomorphomonas oryzae]
MRPEPPLVLITGGGSGIGRALALAAARDGAEIALCGRRGNALTETASLLEGSGDPLVIPADLTTPAGRTRVIDTIADRWGRLDILINNAGIVEGGPHDSFDDEAVEHLFATNVLAPMALTRAAFPLLQASRAASPRVVNVGSVFGEIAYPEFAAYSASKFALRGFSSALRREWKRHGIEVTYASPRATRTDAAAAFDDLIESQGMSLDAPDAVARRIWKAVRRGRRTVYPAGPERLFILIQSLFPALIDRALTAK